MDFHISSSDENLLDRNTHPIDIIPHMTGRLEVESYKFSLTRHPEEYLLVRVNNIDKALPGILKLILKSDDTNLFSYTQSRNPDEISMIMSVSDYEQHFQNNRDCWCSEKYVAIQFDTGELLNESGVLSKLTQKFAEHRISILNITTYAYNYFLFPSDEFINFQKMISENENIDYNTKSNPLE